MGRDRESKILKSCSYRRTLLSSLVHVLVHEVQVCVATCTAHVYVCVWGTCLLISNYKREEKKTADTPITSVTSTIMTNKNSHNGPTGVLHLLSFAVCSLKHLLCSVEATVPRPCIVICVCFWLQLISSFGSPPLEKLPCLQSENDYVIRQLHYKDSFVDVKNTALRGRV